MGGSNTQNPGFQLAPSAGGAVYPQSLFPAATPAATPTPTPAPVVQQRSTVPAGPTLYSTEGSIVSMTPEQISLYNAEQRKVQQQDAAFAANMERNSKQHEGQQNEAYATAFANRDSGFSLPKTQPRLDSPNLYGREAKAPDTQK